MRRWLKFEILDIEAIQEAINKKSEMEKRKILKVNKRNEDQEDLYKMKQGKDTFFTFFKSKEGKINKITELTNSIASCERDIECLDLLHKIIVL